MKRALSLLFIINISVVFAENTIIAIVNNSLITYNSIEIMLSKVNSKEQKIDIINQKINNILQLQKAKEFGIEASLYDLNLALVEISKNNNILLEQLRSYPEFSSIEFEISEKISISNLKRYITKDISASENELLEICFKEASNKDIKQIKIAQIIISEIEAQSQNNQDIAIKKFLNKISDHITKGGSFKAFAKLYSQHSSYLNGGKTDWIEVNNPIVTMLDSLKDNEVSEIYLTDFGLAIGIKLEERFVNSNLKQCKEKLIYLNAEKFYSNWLKRLREQAYIKIYHDAL